MKKYVLNLSLLLASGTWAASVDVVSPDGRLKVVSDISDGRPVYSVSYDGKSILENSPLGIKSDIGDLSTGMSLVESRRGKVSKSFDQDKIKKSHIEYEANQLITTLKNSKGHTLDIEWLVSDNDIAFRYLIPCQGDTGAMVINEEVTGFRFPEQTTAFLTSQSDAMIGWKRTKPSYEEFYITDAPLDSASKFGQGFTFPALFRIGNDGWALLTETGVDGYYCASHLTDYKDGVFFIAYPMPEENNGNGTTAPGISLPGTTPWRTITVADNLAPIAETTIPWNVVEPRYEVKRKARPSRGTWSWIVWQDNSMNMEDQKTFIDLAADLGYEHILIDAGWDKNIGYDRMPELLGYAKSKGIRPALWYSSSGYWNDIVQSPINKMDRPIVRKKEMKWLRDNGVECIKVDFFGGDKQETMRLYEDILSDAADFGIDVIFHGCTLPRGWERMYPNHVGSEAVFASENLIFEQIFCDMEAFHATLHPFIRNSVAMMEYGGTFFNHRMGRDNNSGSIRRTGDGFQIATAVLFQNPVQNFAITPNNLTDAPADAIAFMKDVPTTWGDTKLIEGYPGKYVVLARRNGDKWYIAGVNAQKDVMKLKLDLSSLGVEPGSAVILADEKGKELKSKTLKVKNVKSVPVEILPDGGFVMIIE
ncbi:glycoside hydrolase family 97 protein [Duncaniella freteri]|uniref:glycoside hydrolase family 97 protein n=3 Tax=Duncaniella TaxID=2518495 RepID=UPI00136B4B11|nr:glycoside hydrolase family 97 protein [Duncaniella freteri]NBJ07739.1 glycoside hydrolase family 97 protein [Alistipes sp. Z76]NCE69782.1 glycoside hydrolase family 97 protein [Muribaculaceae bacterium M3]